MSLPQKKYLGDLPALDHVEDLLWEGAVFQISWYKTPMINIFPCGRDDMFTVTFDEAAEKFIVESHYYGKRFRFNTASGVVGFLYMYMKGLVYIQYKDGVSRLKHYLTD